jgi:hypothetical protein
MRTLLITFIFMIAGLVIHAQNVNEKIVKYCKSQMGKTVDRGECWDLVSFALNDAQAKWNNYDIYGKVYSDQTKIKAGDVLEFHETRFDNPDGTWFMMGEHYAIVYEVKTGGEIVIVHQNHNNIRKVQTLNLDLDNLTKGEIIFYRPEGK